MNVAIANDRKELKCACCALPFGYIQNGVLVVISRHNGEKHTNVLTLERIRELLEDAE